MKGQTWALIENQTSKTITNMYVGNEKELIGGVLEAGDRTIRVLYLSAMWIPSATIFEAWTVVWLKQICRDSAEGDPTMQHYEHENAFFGFAMLYIALLFILTSGCWSEEQTILPTCSICIFSLVTRPTRCSAAGVTRSRVGFGHPRQLADP